MLARVIDHAASEQSIAVATFLRSLGAVLVAELDTTQPLNACGYVAADAAVALHAFFVTLGRGWHQQPIPTASPERVREGNAVLALPGGDAASLLTGDEIIELATVWSRCQATGCAWLSGCLSLTNFYAGIEVFAAEALAADSEHWRAFVVNTLDDVGSHWFTVILHASPDRPWASPPRPAPDDGPEPSPALTSSPAADADAASPSTTDHPAACASPSSASSASDEILPFAPLAQ